MTKRIRCLIPKLEELLRKNVALKELDKKPSKSPSKMPNKVKRGDTDARGIPIVYREGSAYQTIFSILWAQRQQGITRDALVKKAMSKLGIDEQHIRFNCAVVLSCRRNNDGTFYAHRSAQKAIDSYYCNVADGGAIQLVMRQQPNR